MGASSLVVLATVGLLCGVCEAFQLPLAAAPRAPHACSSVHACRMMFGGGGKQDGEGGGFLEQMKAAKEMFNPENMKKYAALGEKIQSLQTELAQTEVEVATNGGAIVVKTSAMQVPISVEVSEAMLAKGAEVVSAEVAVALKQAHTKSGMYMNQRMAELYQEMGIPTPGGGRA